MSTSTRESVQFNNISADTAAFKLRGGRYAVTFNGTGSGTVTLKRLSADGTTYVTCATPFTANGYNVSDLPVGTYMVTVATWTAVYVDIQSVAVAV